MDSSILVVGGAGFVGTHTVVQLLNQGFKVTIYDDIFVDSVGEVVRRVREVVGPDLSRNLQLHVASGYIMRKDEIEMLFSRNKFDAVIHFYGFRLDIKMTLFDYLYTSQPLYQVMMKYNCKKLVYSSPAATLYGQPEKLPCVEDSEIKINEANVYQSRAVFDENVARRVHEEDSEWRVILLRYFNPVGAHESGKLGEDPNGIPNNLMRCIQQVAVGRLPKLNVYGHDYRTKDGSAVRDYIHVMDLADGHVTALKKLFTKADIGCFTCNLGTGRGTSVLEMVAAFKKASGRKIPIKRCARREGDATEVYASTDKAEKELQWKAKYGIEEMCRDQWKWACQNPWGYRPNPE